MSLPKHMSDLMARYGINADEIWKVRDGAYAIKHKALERIAFQEKIELEEIYLECNDLDKKHAIVRARMRKNGRTVTSFGEAAPYNNRNAYPVAIAEKRAIDRCVLKHLQVHGEVYSEDEVDSTDPGDRDKGRLLRSNPMSRELYKQLEQGLRNTTDLGHLEEWRNAHKDQLRSLPQDFLQQLNEAIDVRVEELTASGRTGFAREEGHVRHRVQE